MYKLNAWFYLVNMFLGKNQQIRLWWNGNYAVLWNEKAIPITKL